MKRRVLFLGLGAAILGLLMSGPVIAQETLHGCSKVENGQLRIVSNSEECLPSEFSLLINGALAGPQTIYVDCGAGETVSGALEVAPPNVPLTINISGVCQESLTITRDDITLRGSSFGDGFADPPEWFALNLVGAHRIRLENLTLTGGNTGVNAASGSTFEASGLRVSNASNNGINLRMEASGTLSYSIIENCEVGISTSGSSALNVYGGEVNNSTSFGVTSGAGSYVSLGGGFKVTGSGHQAVFAAAGGSIDITDTIVEDNESFGVWAMEGGHIGIGSNTHVRRNDAGGVVAWGATATLRQGAQVINNQGNGVTATYGGSLHLEGGPIIENNQGQGIYLTGVSVASISDSIIQNNSDNGILITDTSVALFHGTSQIIGNGGNGILCHTDPAVAQITGNPGTVTGNTRDPQIDCPQNP